MNEIDTFNSFYRKDQLSFGATPTREISDLLTAWKGTGRALDLGAGDGRNSLFLARSGFDVTAVDFSKIGLEKLVRFAKMQGLPDQIHAVCADVRRWDCPPDYFDLIIAVTIFDHLNGEDIAPLFERVDKGLKKGGALFIRVHTIDDPGHNKSGRPASELAPMIHHYFGHNELLKMVFGKFRVVLYEEKSEEDHTHGQPHQHGFAHVSAFKTN